MEVSKEQFAATREELAAQLRAALERVEALKRQIYIIDTAPENNVFPTMQEAEDILTFRLGEEAAMACEGANNCGADTYRQEFIVNGVHYIGTLEVEYNRHDKTYYYIEDTYWTAKPKAAAN